MRQRSRLKVKMISPRGWILVIGLLVFLVAGGDSQDRPQTFIGHSCCKEDWETFMDGILKEYKTHAANLKSQAFLAALQSFMSMWDKVPVEEVIDLCGGHVGFKCAGTKNSSKCECNKVTKHVPDKDNKTCMAQGLGSVCMAGSKNCLAGTCDVAAGKSFGECKVGGVDNSKSGTGVDKTGVDDKEKGKGTASSSYIQRPIMWVIIGGLALVSTS